MTEPCPYCDGDMSVPGHLLECKAFRDAVEASEARLPWERFDGETFSAARDGARLYAQLQRVWLVMRDAGWHTLRELAGKTGDPEGSVSARLRDLRKQKFGAHDIERRYVERGLWEYRLSR